MKRRGSSYLLAAATAVVVALGAALWFGGIGGGGTAAGAWVVVEQGVTPGARLGGVVADEADGGVAAAREAQLGSVEEELPPRVRSSLPRDGFEHRVVVVDEHGIEHAEENGQLSVRSTTGGGSTVVQVVAGRALVKLVGPLEPRHGTLGGRDVLAAPHAPAARLHDGEPPVLRTAWVRETVVRVVAADTGIDLGGFEYTLRAGAPTGGGPPPQFYSREEKRRGDSPLVLGPRDAPETTGPSTLSVRLRGYAFGSFAFDLRLPGERRFELQPAGDLEVAVEPAWDERSFALQVLRPGDPEALLAVAWGPIRTPTRFADLPIGPVEVEAVEEGATGERRVLGRTEATIERGATTPVTLCLAEPETREESPLAGTLVLPREWRGVPESLRTSVHNVRTWGRSRAARTAALVPMPGGDEETFGWSIGALESGSCLLELDARLPWVWIAFRFDHQSPGRGDLALVVPPRADATVRLVDAETGAPVRVESLRAELT
ncbi:MAG TPA: hypothetical protein VJP77_02335, partial [Planctomycetota bacterium]|nr:hypothetical protein [Planctomycetota bacterium]